MSNPLIPDRPRTALEVALDRAVSNLRGILAVRWENIKNLRPGDGLNTKYVVVRMDGRDGPGEKHYNDQYFVLDIWHDPYAIPALSAYAAACGRDEPRLAADLMNLMEIAVDRHLHG